MQGERAGAPIVGTPEGPQTHPPMGAEREVRSMAGSVRSVNQARPPVLSPGQLVKLMVRMDAMVAMKTGS